MTISRKMRAALVGIAIAAGVVLSGGQAAVADVDDFTFESLDVDYTLTRDEDGTSELHVVETFVAQFPETPQNRGIRRVIPDTYNGQPLNAQLISITDGEGNPRPEEVDRDDGAVSFTSRADDYLLGRQTFVIEYELENVVWDFDDSGLEFYWDVNGNDWAQPFGEVTATLHLDESLADKMSGEFACYQGRVGPPGTGDLCASIAEAPEGGGVAITATAMDLAPYETLTFAVGFDDGTFELFDSSYYASGFGWAQTVAGAGLLGSLLLAVRARRKHLRDEPGRSVIIAEYGPPKEVDALESAVFLSKTSKAIPAEVVEQAVVGSIRILEGEKRAFRKTPLVAELVDPSLADYDGRLLLEALFPGGKVGDQYEFESSDTRLSRMAAGILGAAQKKLEERGLYRKVKRGARAVPAILLGVSAAAVLLFGVLALTASVFPAVPVILIVAAALALVAGVLILGRRPLTAAGAELRDHLQGLREFIEWAEADRIRMLQSPETAERVRVGMRGEVAVDVNDSRQMLHLYERLLPFAIAFDQETKWAEALAHRYEDVGVTAPAWYAGTSAFSASAFASSVTSLSSAASSSSSTSGGSTGGGSAGGGGGGGGGGGV